DGHGDDGLHVFSIRGIVSFFAIGGWAGFACLSNSVPALVAILVAFLAGAATMVALAKLIQVLMRLQESGNVSKKNAIGKMGNVYLRIPEAGKGMGKINIVVQEQHQRSLYLLDGAVVAFGKSVVVAQREHLDRCKNINPINSKANFKLFFQTLSMVILNRSYEIRVLFSGQENNHFVDNLEESLKAYLFSNYPSLRNNIDNNLLLTFTIQGSYRTFVRNSTIKSETLVEKTSEMTLGLFESYSF
ncbi:MAG: hypothetical protein IIU39_03735, partial [Ruminococcus sp.]|nr:hypothetical protein [Ruminococcus sp.]